MLALVGDGHVGGGDPAPTTCPPRPWPSVGLAHAPTTSMRPVSAAHTVSPTNTMAARVRRRATPISKIRSLVSPNILPLQPNAVLRRPRQVIPGCLSLLYAASEAVSCALVSRVALRRFAAS